MGDSCVGIDSDHAGVAPGCKGCPNAGLCSSGKAKIDESTINLDIQKRLSAIKNIILVISGKGGVGKSTVACNVARYLAIDENRNVGLLDIDITGPSVPRAMGLEEEQVHTSATGWSPVYIQDNLAVMSAGFLLGSLDDAVIWRGPKKHNLIKQFLKDVDWPELDYLVIDTPPGTSDEHISIVGYLKNCDNFRGALIVTTPQEAALQDVRKQIDFCQKIGLKVIGLVQNMSHITCPNCKKQSYILKPTTGGAASLSESYKIPLLGDIPIDPIVGKNIDNGSSCFDENSSSEAVKAFQELADNIVREFKK
ncbi:cytosolic Fe-S cluster assembly factor NUBP1-like [Brevipalpus obovatus]|uniref:cytosolic Fe-S cluster assembly factor NUBP1-like n=1 Tax=Brevipalpus obovatus TaxID=246614 RepID=UPI003D9DF0EF